MWTFIGIKYNIPVSLAATSESSYGCPRLFIRCLHASPIHRRQDESRDLTSKVLEMLVRIYQRVSGTA